MFLTKLCLTLIHFFISVNRFVVSFLKRLESSWHVHIYNSFYFKERSSKTGNVPEHVAVVILDENICFQRLGQIIHWSGFAGISYVTLFDPRGIIKKNEEDIMYEVARKTITSSNYANEKKTNFIFHKSVIKNKNGYDAYTTNVVLLSAEDNQRQLVNVSRQLCDKTNHSEVNVDSVDSLLKKVFQFPEPNIIFNVGKVNCLAGFLPWHIRLSEILSFDTLNNLDYKSFHSALDKYKSIEKRFGR